MSFLTQRKIVLFVSDFFIGQYVNLSHELIKKNLIKSQPTVRITLEIQNHQ
jgi:hypothetical protein